MNVLQSIANRFGLRTESQVKIAAQDAVRKYRSGRRALGIHPAAVKDRLTEDWSTQTLSADALLRSSLEATRARSRLEKEANDYLQKFFWMLKTNVLGECGIVLKNMAKDPDLFQGGKMTPGRLDVFANARIEDWWRDFSLKENCTVTRDMTLQEVSETCLETVGTDGETLARKVRNFPNRHGFALQLFESDHLEVGLNRELRDGRYIRMGIEFDQWGAPVAYHLRKKNPNDNAFGFTSVSVDPMKYERIPAADIVHPFIGRRIGQSRGFPWVATPLTRSHMLRGYEEGELVGARAAAHQLGVLEYEGDQEYQGDPADDGTGAKLMDSEPGQWLQMPKGVQAKPIQWNRPNANFDAFEKRMLRGIAAGLLCSYNILADDMESVNFSSARIGLMEPREVYKLLQRWWASDFLSPIFSDWLEVQLIAGNIPLPVAKFDKFNSPRWRGRRWPYLEPTKDVEAAIRRINSGLSTPSKELEDLGVDDFDEHLERLKSEQEKIKSMGLTLPELFQLKTLPGAGKPPENDDEPERAVA